MSDLRDKYAICRKCGSYYPPEAGHSEASCRDIARWRGYKPHPGIEEEEGR